MISFTIMTSTPGALRDRLIARDVIRESVITAPDGTQHTELVGVYRGLEWVAVPNPIVVTEAVGEPYLPTSEAKERNPDYVPATMDSRRCYLVKLEREAEGKETEGFPPTGPLIDRTKLGQWVKNNSVPETITSADGRSWPSLKVGNNFWLLNSDDFGVWQ